jgi:hypothetical protein
MLLDAFSLTAAVVVLANSTLIACAIRCVTIYRRDQFADRPRSVPDSLPRVQGPLLWAMAGAQLVIPLFYAGLGLIEHFGALLPESFFRRRFPVAFVGSALFFLFASLSCLLERTEAARRQRLVDVARGSFLWAGASWLVAVGLWARGY